MAISIVFFCKYHDRRRFYFYQFIKIFFIFFSRHVQVNNEDAIAFYKKFGFEIVETKEHYYKRIEPADAHVLQKTLRPGVKASLVNGKMTNGEIKHQE